MPDTLHKISQPGLAEPGLAERIAPNLPFLRRYARALSGAQESGDAQVAALLEALIASPALVEAEGASDRVALYRAFQRRWVAIESVGAAPTARERTTETSARERTTDTSARERTTQERLARLTPPARQALLLSAVEGFTLVEIGQILDIRPEDATALVEAAQAELKRQLSARVLIIEDEPMIAMDIAAIVTDLGHSVVATANTQAKAVEAALAHRPELVLADIRLAGGGSGVEAVREILAAFSVPVIFITAYPERLFSGVRPEPTFLIAKPFKATAVQAAVSQALFFRSSENIQINLAAR